MDTNETIAELQRRLEPTQRINKSLGFLSYDGNPYLNLLDRITCADGFAMSVQASHTHYCQPRDSVGPYHAVEIGFPTERVEAFMPYIDGNPETEDPTCTVYGYVPIEIVADAIIAHGGFAA